MTTTYTGTVSSGFDGRGDFFQAGTDLTGMTFKVVFLTDDATVGVESTSDAVSSFISGGFQTPANPLSPVKATVTIGGASFQLDGGFQGTSLEVASTCAPDCSNGEIGSVASEFKKEGLGFFGTRNVAMELFSNNPKVFSGDYHKSLFHVVQPGEVNFPDSSHGRLTDNFFDETAGEYIYNTFADFDIATVRVGSVPEPGTWALLIFGLAAVGTAMRRRKLAIASG
ncbi:PEPxxWA-CTERM sorting domain-containing protein [Phenylobacterium sp.]|uniref:PEPxxWA-CTERM sorting domain-containing protein n=1 Tax=Phenylobacterium sp. TaxID=1871053 RepID=UPI0025D449F8|nr:PEPxxWA-CTERM sorting domain-containing protein [Phenylobacterium sp.]